MPRNVQTENYSSTVKKSDTHKRLVCFICKHLALIASRHLKRKQSNATLVAEVISKKRPERNLQLPKLRNLSSFHHKVHVLTKVLEI